MSEPGAVRCLLDVAARRDSDPNVTATPRLDLLGFDVEMQTPDAELTEFLTALYAPMRRDGTAAHVLSLTSSGPIDAPTWAVHLDAVRVIATPARSVAFQYLLWEANRQAIDRTTDRVIVHASAAARDGMAIVLPGPMGAGKSTLVAALVRAGLGYLTDEAVAIDPTTGLVAPYPKYLSLAGVLAHLVPPAPGRVQAFLGGQRLAAPDAIRPGSVAAAAAPRLVVAPRYQPGASTTLEPLRPAAALSALAEHAFHIGRDDQRTLDVLATMVEQSACFRLVSSDVDEATAALIGLLDSHTSSSTATPVAS